MKKQCNGFTLMELLVAIGIVAVLAALSFPAFSSWIEDARYRESASRLIAALRQGRARAISTNLEHRVEIDLPAKKFRLTQGNRAERSTETSFDANVILDWYRLSPEQVLKANDECDGSSTSVKYHFNPNGTGSFRYLCILDANGRRRYRVGVPGYVTGKMIAQKWTSTGWK